MAGLSDIQGAQYPADYAIRYTRGDSLQLEFEVRDGRNRPVDLTGLDVEAVATQAWGYAVTFTLDAVITDPAAGLVSVGWEPGVGALLPTQGVWGLTLVGADWRKTLVTGSLTESPSGAPVCGPCGGSCTGGGGSCSC